MRISYDTLNLLSECGDTKAEQAMKQWTKLYALLRGNTIVCAWYRDDYFNVATARGNNKPWAAKPDGCHEVIHVRNY